MKHASSSNISNRLMIFNFHSLVSARDSMGNFLDTHIHLFEQGIRTTQPNSHYTKYTAASVLKSATLSTSEGHSLPCTMVNTRQWPRMCPPGRQRQGTVDCPLPWCTSKSLGCRMLQKGCCTGCPRMFYTVFQKNIKNIKSTVSLIIIAVIECLICALPTVKISLTYLYPLRYL